MRFKATIDIYLDVSDRWSGDFDGALADGIHAIMDNVVETTADSDGFTVIDWSYHPDADGDFEAGYAQLFDGATPEEERVGWEAKQHQPADPTDDEVTDWRYAVVNGDTKRGLIDWVAARREDAEND